MNRYIYVAIGTLIALGPLAADDDHFTFTQNMSAHDQNAIGLQNLSAPEQRSLEKWIDLWTNKIVNQVLIMGCECDTRECLHSIFNRVPSENMRRPGKDNKNIILPSSEDFQQPLNVSKQPLSRPPQNSDSAQQPWQSPTEKYIKPQQQQAGVPLGQTSLVSEIMQNGGYVKLNDGTVWEVSQNDRASSANWQPFDQVQLAQSSVPGRFQLIDMTQNQRVEVVKPGTAPAPINPAQMDKNLQPANYFVDNNLDNGQKLVLQNGLVLNVRVGDAVRTSRNWATGTAVQISQVGGAYPYSVRNIQTGEIVQAQLQK